MMVSSQWPPSARWPAITCSLFPLLPMHWHSVCCRDWNPAVDKHLPQQYDVTNFKAGKAACKKALQEELGLPVNPDIPMIAFIGRLDYQKGADIVLQVGALGCAGSRLVLGLVAGLVVALVIL